MKYLEKTIKFFTKNYLLALPLWALTLIPAILGGRTVSLLSKSNYWLAIFRDPSSLGDPSEIFSLVSSLIPLFLGAGVIGFILRFVIYPPTYGLINKALETGHADLNEFVPSLKENIVKYIMYWLGTIVVGVILTIVLFVVFLILALLISILKWFGALLAFVVLLGLVVIGLIINAFLGLWFPAMIVDNLDVISAFKKSVEVVRMNLLTIVGITLLISLVGAIIGSILSFLNFIPLIGPIITSVIPTATSFILTTFYILIYRDKEGKVVADN